MQNLEIEKPGYKSNLRPTDDKLFEDMRKMATAIRGNIHDVDMLNKGVEAFPDQIADLNKTIIMNKSNITRNYNAQNKSIDELRRANNDLRKRIDGIKITDNSSELEGLRQSLLSNNKELMSINEKLIDLQPELNEIKKSKSIIYVIITILAILTIISLFV